MDFEEVVELHYRALYRFALSLTRQESDAADLTQETFVIWAEKQGQLRDGAKVKSWLFTTLHREFLARRRRIVRFPEVEISAVEEELPESPPVSTGHFDAPTVLAALDRIDPTFRAAIALFYLEDCTQAEIAEILETPLGTVKSRISRGLAQLQKLLMEKATEPAGRSAV